jgi:hypothetical protein
VNEDRNDLAWWSALKSAAEAGCTDFDLWGIPPPNSGPAHPWHGLGEGIRRVDTGDGEPMLAIDDLSGLIGLVQAGVVEIHPWGSTIEQLEQPDRLIFDLDPGEDVTWDAVILGAREVRERLQKSGLSFVRHQAARACMSWFRSCRASIGMPPRRSPDQWRKR